MKKFLVVAFLLINLTAVQANAQCHDTHLLCAKQLSKTDKKAGWNINQQSQSISFEKGENYEMTLTAHQGLEYRLSVCTDIEGGTAANFQLAHDVRVTVEDEDGNTHIERQRKVIFDSTDENADLYVLFRSDKTEKFYLTVNVAAAGKSATKKLKNTDLVCVGVLLAHKRTEKSAL